MRGFQRLLCCVQCGSAVWLSMCFIALFFRKCKSTGRNFCISASCHSPWGCGVRETERETERGKRRERGERERETERETEREKERERERDIYRERERDRLRVCPLMGRRWYRFNRLSAGLRCGQLYLALSFSLSVSVG